MSRKKKGRNKKRQNVKDWGRRPDHQKTSILCSRAPKSESALAPVLRAGVLGYRFAWNYRVGNYFPDFVCEPLGLIVEVDGSSHHNRKVEDEHRQLMLERQGYRFLRLRASMALSAKLASVEAFVRETIRMLRIKPEGEAS